MFISLVSLGSCGCLSTLPLAWLQARLDELARPADEAGARPPIRGEYDLDELVPPPRVDEDTGMEDFTIEERPTIMSPEERKRLEEAEAERVHQEEAAKRRRAAARDWWA